MVTPRQALTLTGISAGALGLAFAAGRWTAPRDRTEHTRHATATTQGEAQKQSRDTEDTTGTRDTQERSGEREEERRPDGTVRVVTRWKEGEVRERVVVKTVVEVKEVVKWKEKIVEVEKLVKVKAPSVKLPRWSLSMGPAFGGASHTGWTRPDGVAMGAGVRVVGPAWLHLHATRAGDETTAALMVGVTFQ